MQPLPSDAVALAHGLSREFLVAHRLCPLRRGDDGLLTVAAAPAAYLDGVDELSIAYGAPIVVQEATDDELDRFIERLATRTERSIELERAESGSDDLATDVRDLANQPPVIRYVNLLVRDAYDAGASDIHLEATRQGLLARLRLDGVLAPAQEPPSDLQQAVVSRIKLLAELDIADRRRPQDGRIRVRLEQQELDLRVSTVPTMFGESVVLRLLDRGNRPAALAELGMDAELLARVSRLAARPHGMLLVTGPTGSGKTTTLYGCLQLRDATAEKIITVEDPIEYHLEGVTQVPVHRSAGVSFGAALRSILRQDPDIVMIGEMRDLETAEIAVQAAMTGHLVFSTLHTNDATGAIPRLLDLGIPAYLLCAVLDGVLAQRLVRRICDSCRAEIPAPEHVLRAMRDAGADTVHVYTGMGCDACRGTGFRGRVGIFERLVLDEHIRELIARGGPRDDLRRAAHESGMRTMLSDGWSKVGAGLTTVEELLRVVQN